MNDDLDVRAIRRHFAFPGTGRVMADNAASTQAPRELTGLHNTPAEVDRAVAAVAAIAAGPRAGGHPRGRRPALTARPAP